MTEPKKADDAKATTARVGKNAEYPQLIVSQWVRGEPLGYECSLCAQVFTLSEDLDPKESAARLIAEFQNHLEKMHPEKR